MHISSRLVRGPTNAPACVRPFVRARGTLKDVRLPLREPLVTQDACSCGFPSCFSRSVPAEVIPPDRAASRAAGAAFRSSEGAAHWESSRLSPAHPLVLWLVVSARRLPRQEDPPLTARCAATGGGESWHRVSAYSAPSGSDNPSATISSPRPPRLEPPTCGSTALSTPRMSSGRHDRRARLPCRRASSVELDRRHLLLLRRWWKPRWQDQGRGCLLVA